MSFIKVTYEVYGTLFKINKVLKQLENYNVLSFDVETRSSYSTSEVQEAKDLLKQPETINPEYLILVKQVAKSSGLSCPQLIHTTHFIFGISETKSIILVAPDKKTETALWNWVVSYAGKLLIHNTGFDLKICYQRTGRFPVDYEDTQLLAKCYINNADNWKAKTGLKVLMGTYYDPKWTLFENYDVKNLMDKDFLKYCAIDGCSTVKLWNQLGEFKCDQ